MKSNKKRKLIKGSVFNKGKRNTNVHIYVGGIHTETLCGFTGKGGNPTSA